VVDLEVAAPRDELLELPLDDALRLGRGAVRAEREAAHEVLEVGALRPDVVLPLVLPEGLLDEAEPLLRPPLRKRALRLLERCEERRLVGDRVVGEPALDRKSTRLNSSHRTISY